MIRRPTDKVEDLRASTFDIIDFLSGILKTEIKKIDITAIASSTITLPLTTNTFTKLHGAIQIASTATEQAYVQYCNTLSVNVSWDFGAGTSGKQTVTFLLIGS